MVEFTPEQLRVFAENLSRDEEAGACSMGQAAVAAGLKATQGLHMFNRLKRDLGPQAK